MMRLRQATWVPALGGADLSRKPRHARRARMRPLRRLTRLILTGSLLWAVALCLVSTSTSTAAPVGKGALTNEAPVSGEVTKATPEGSPTHSLRWPESMSRWRSPALTSKGCWR